MSNTSLVSIVIPTYNSARWLAEAVDSALGQTYPDMEILVFDNASTDNTPDLMKSYDDPRLTYFQKTENVGFAGNVTRGIRAAKGAFFMVLGADDILEPTFVETAVMRLQSTPTAQMLHGGAIWIDDDGKPIGTFDGDWPETCSGDDAFIRTFTSGFCYSCVFSRMAPVKSLGAMDETWGMISDSWLFLKLCLAGDVLFIKEPLVRYRVRESSLSFELYADGKMFDDQMSGLKEAFAWAEAGHLQPRIHQAKIAVAQQAFDTLHMTRIGAGLSGAVRKAVQIVSAEPRILLAPQAWVRFGFSVLPAPLIRSIRKQRKNRLEVSFTTENSEH